MSATAAGMTKTIPLSNNQIVKTEFGLDQAMIKGVKISAEMIVYLREFKKQNNNDIKKISEEFQKIKHLSILQLKGLIAGYTLEDVKSAWFSEAHLSYIQTSSKHTNVHGLNKMQLKLWDLGVDKKIILEYKGKITDAQVDAVSAGILFVSVQDLNDIEVKMVRAGVDHKELREAKAKGFIATELHLKALELNYDFADIARYNEVKLAKVLAVVRGETAQYDSKNSADFRAKKLSSVQRELILELLDGNNYQGRLTIHSVLQLTNSHELSSYDLKRFLEDGNRLEDISDWDYNCMNLYQGVEFSLSISQINTLKAKNLPSWKCKNVLARGFTVDQIKDLEPHRFDALAHYKYRFTLEQVKSIDFTPEVWGMIDGETTDVQNWVERELQGDSKFFARLNKLSAVQKRLIGLNDLSNVSLDKVEAFNCTAMHLSALIASIPFEQVEKLSGPEVTRLMETWDGNLKSAKDTVSTVVSTTAKPFILSTVGTAAANSAVASASGHASSQKTTASTSSAAAVAVAKPSSPNNS